MWIIPLTNGYRVLSESKQSISFKKTKSYIGCCKYAGVIWSYSNGTFTHFIRSAFVLLSRLFLLNPNKLKNGFFVDAQQP